MKIIKAMLNEISKTTFDIGYVGEKNHTRVDISCASMFQNYPNAVATMVAKSPVGELYPVSLTRDGNHIIWDVTESDIAHPGSGQYQLTFTDGDGDNAEVIKTAYGAYSVKQSLVENGEPPTPIEDWLQEASVALETFESEIEDIDTITAATSEDVGKALSPKTVANGKVTEWDYIDPLDPEVVEEAVDNWLEEHPEATTTVEDGAITYSKLNQDLKSTVKVLSVVGNKLVITDHD